MQRRALTVVVCTLFSVLASVHAMIGDAVHAVDAPPSYTRFESAPLDAPIALTGTFGEARNSHFHAGLDLSTRERVGVPVMAPIAGLIVRVRTSGAGYGRSLYLLAEDGRLLVFGHLDAFDEPIAGWIAAIQDSSGSYEQDLWPDSAAFPVRAGQRIGWSGRSGTGPPHLHFEVRHGDTALNPLNAGAEVIDARAPQIRAVTFEPLDGASSVEGRVAPHTIEWGTDSAATLASGSVVRLRAHGRLRVIVEALDARANGRLSMAPYSLALEWRDRRYECRFDSVSWAEGMAEVDLVYDRGRATTRGSSTVVLWSPAGFRSRVVHASEPLAEAAGTVTVDGGEESMRVIARDAAGHEASRRFVLEDGGAPRSHEASGLFGPRAHEFMIPRPDFHELESGDYADPLQTAWLLAPGELRLASLPDGWLRVEIQGKRWRERSPRGLDFLGTHLLDPAAPRLAVLVRPDSLPRDVSLRLAGDTPRWTAHSRPLRLIAAAGGGGGELAGLRFTIPAAALFEPAVWAVTTTPLATRNPELLPVGPVYMLEPEDHPLRASIGVALAVPERYAPERLGLYRDTGDGWEWVRADFDSITRRMRGESRRLGRFALFRDPKAPRIAKVSAPKRSVSEPYSTWALEARLTDQGSDVDARASRWVVDGRRVPSEWDAEERILRWRPLRAPGAGRHRYTVIAVDRAGNVRNDSGTFVVEGSPGR